MNTTASNPEHNIDGEQAGTEAGPGAGQETGTAHGADHGTDHGGANGTSAGPGYRPGWGPGPSDLFGNLNELRRPVQGRLLGGVAAGLARYINADVNLVRIGFVLLAFLGGAAVPVYILAWLLIPEDGAAQSIAGELFSSLENRSR